ncbi:hypothetical protein BH09PAT1_BH09PAT1_4460 [soil metagenome]
MNIAEKKDITTKVIASDSEAGRIYLTHVTVRQSIFFLVLKLFVLEVLAAVGIVIFHSVLFASNAQVQYYDLFSFYMIPLYIILIIIKMGLTVVIIVQWLEDYYEITNTEIIHKKGLFFSREEHFLLKHLGSIKIEQGLIGRIFHYGTITVFDWVNSETMSMYLIHNPIKYHKILQTIAPDTDKELHVIREHLTISDDE